MKYILLYCSLEISNISIFMYTAQAVFFFICQTFAVVMENLGRMGQKKSRSQQNFGTLLMKSVFTKSLQLIKRRNAGKDVKNKTKQNPTQLHFRSCITEFLQLCKTHFVSLTFISVQQATSKQRLEYVQVIKYYEEVSSRNCGNVLGIQVVHPYLRLSEKAFMKVF